MEILKVEQLTMRFGGLVAVDDLTFGINEGEIRGLIGPNGAGKTTIFNVVSGFYRPTSGRVLFKGEVISGLKMSAVAAKGVIRTFQLSTLFQEFTLLENVLVGCHLHRQPSLLGAVFGTDGADREAAMEKALSLLDLFNLLPLKDTLAAELPHGLQRALGMVVAIAADPKLLMLDEPFTGMNAEETQAMMELMRKTRERGVTILLVEHDMRAVMGLCDFITVVNFGRMLVQGSPDVVRNHPEVIEAYLGTPHHAA